MLRITAIIVAVASFVLFSATRSQSESYRCYIQDSTLAVSLEMVMESNSVKQFSVDTATIARTSPHTCSFLFDESTTQQVTAGNIILTSKQKDSVCIVTIKPSGLAYFIHFGNGCGPAYWCGAGAYFPEEIKIDKQREKCTMR
jgi:hypothetical protein